MCAEINKTPWSTFKDLTAPSPKWKKVEWYIYNDAADFKAVALNLTWSQSGKLACSVFI